MSTDYTPDSSGWSAALYNKNANFVYSSAYTSPVLELLAAKPGEKIIDFGCGSGEVTVEIEKIVNEKEGGHLAAVDFSESMIEKAKVNGLSRAFVCDIQNFSFPTPESGYTGPRDQFDAVFTNAALHWCKRDPSGAIKSAKKILKKDGGRFVGEMGGFLNCIGIRSVLRNVLKTRGYDPIQRDPWFFPSPEEYTRLLKAEGLNVTHISLTPRCTPLPTGLYGWMSVFVRHTSWLSDLPDKEAEEIMREVEDLLRADCQDADENWAIIYVRLRFVALLEDK